MKKTVNILIVHVLALMVTLTIATGCENNRAVSEISPLIIIVDKD